MHYNPQFNINSTQECFRRDNYVSDELATFTLKLVYQDPKNGFEEGQPLEKEGIDRLTNLCVEKIIDDRGPLMETVRMQVILIYKLMENKTAIF